MMVRNFSLAVLAIVAIVSIVMATVLFIKEREDMTACHKRGGVFVRPAACLKADALLPAADGR